MAEKVKSAQVGGGKDEALQWGETKIATIWAPSI